MTIVHMRRLLAAVGLVTLSLLVLMALILPAANQTLITRTKNMYCARTTPSSGIII